MVIVFGRKIIKSVTVRAPLLHFVPVYQRALTYITMAAFWKFLSEKYLRQISILEPTIKKS